ncbi:MAG: tRNA uridine-5-carboxymethylaminomethyl(34) synthesis enzyme MnmG [Elusimicrobia bacterium]|nr:tRNA uridine-5-carboxymethylaminomethyl(34) synthesis enzyme MnmG [Elusimicrobiota bacterium]
MISYLKSYDVIVVGAGHAGCEASLACARTGLKTLLLTLNLDSVGQMSCNPSIGGLGKGQVVREMDALGGEMAKNTDATGLQFRILNSSKGPAVQSPRAQCDKKLYQFTIKHTIEKQKNLDLKQGEAIQILTEELHSSERKKVVGILTKSGIEYSAKAVIVTTGTFLKGLLHYGMNHQPGGRAGEGRAEHLTDSLRDLGFEVGRMKTGTPMRLNANTINFSRCAIQPGDEPPIPFSHFTEKLTQKQMPCYLTYTNELTHQIIRESLDRSPLYTGKIKSIGPRYCPSIEDKVVKFPHHKRHQIFLEPEGYHTEEIYVNGLSTSLPEDVQWQIVRTVPGLEDAELMRAGYAVEYDFCPPTQCKPSLETKLVEGLYFAGQICGTTGYEEAGGQGLIAGINASQKIKGEEPLILRRDEAYIGVMIDDLVTKGVDEPYRLFTSRAEYRLLLRSDNSDLRLMDYGFRVGLISKEVHQKFCVYRQRIAGPILPASVLEDIRPWTEEKIERQSAIQKKYAGYLNRQNQMANRLVKMEKKQIPADYDYDSIPGLLNESRQKLKKVLPRTIGQAARIPGITPSDIGILLIYLERQSKKLQTVPS